MKAITKRLIEEHLDKAREKHPCFTIEGIIQVPAIATEELGEMTKEINEAYFFRSKSAKKYLKHKQLAEEEAFDLIAVLIRFIEGD